MQEWLLMGRKRMGQWVSGGGGMRLEERTFASLALDLEGGIHFGLLDSLWGGKGGVGLRSNFYDTRMMLA